MARKLRRKSNLVKKGDKLKKEVIHTAKSGAGFVPGLGTALTLSHTAKGMGRTAKAAKEYGGELYREVKRQIRRRNPLN